MDRFGAGEAGSEWPGGKFSWRVIGRVGCSSIKIVARCSRGFFWSFVADNVPDIPCPLINDAFAASLRPALILTFLCIMFLPLGLVHLKCNMTWLQSGSRSKP